METVLENGPPIDWSPHFFQWFILSKDAASTNISPHGYNKQIVCLTFSNGIRVNIYAYANKIIKNNDLFNDFWHFLTDIAIKIQETWKILSKTRSIILKMLQNNPSQSSWNYFLPINTPLPRSETQRLAKRAFFWNNLYNTSNFSKSINLKFAQKTF